MSGTPETTARIRPWVERAEEDLDVASYELARGAEAPFATVAFHAQQCVEKYLKALLVLHGVDFPKTHDLQALLGWIPASARPALSVSDMNLLTSFVSEGRYPGDWDPPTRKAAEGAVEIARNARELVRKCLPPEALA